MASYTKNITQLATASAPFTTVALFGANGQRPVHTFKVIVFIPPSGNINAKGSDAEKADRDCIAKNPNRVDAMFSALVGPALDAQATIQDAAADAGHPNERATIHPAIRSGKRSFTMVSCGDFYNQEREKIWCPWTQSPSSYTIHVIGDPDVEAEYAHLDDFANFLVATLLGPLRSENQYLNVYTGKKVGLDVQGVDALHEVWVNLKKAPKDYTERSFSVDFWYLVKGTQGKGEFVRPKSQIHNALFPDVTITPFKGYLKQSFGKGGKW
ncbi:hypothetical protein EJ02DRAFT_443008 [Clathrospora elynae]|uniref:NAD(P)-binding protein n=1 Tax=Clathrospora elynae TaxID=706981 RepID=A0A6A5STN6_9PLEO|nr:hypothetical protein EJ02DRAFT_443008 [Clathrospora elynae]